MLYQVMPPLSDSDYAALKADIAERGMMVPIEVDEAGDILDGHHRKKICDELGIHCARFVREGLDEAGKRTHARQLNIARRHLNSEQKRELIADDLRDNPTRSDNQVSGDLGVSDKTVTAVRRELEATSEIPKLERTIGADGKSRPASKPTRSTLIDDTPDGRAAAQRRSREIITEEAAAKKAGNAKIAAIKMAAPDGQYGTIVIDPPWKMVKIERDVAPAQVDFEYPTMDHAELLEFGQTVNAMAHDNCHIFMWTTHKHLPLALELLKEWGWKYVLTMVWHKAGGFQPFGLPQYNCEFCLYARRGAPEFRDTKAFPVCFNAPRGKHSEKPGEFYDVIRRVTHDGRIDVFSRRKIEGFEGWGNESG